MKIKIKKNKDNIKNHHTSSSINPPIFDEEIQETNQNNYDYKSLIQEQANEQFVKQKISQEYTVDIFGKALSNTENYSSKFGKKQIINIKFNYYNLFDSGSIKSKERAYKSYNCIFRHITRLLFNGWKMFSFRSKY